MEKCFVAKTNANGRDARRVIQDGGYLIICEYMRKLWQSIFNHFTILPNWTLHSYKNVWYMAIVLSNKVCIYWPFTENKFYGRLKEKLIEKSDFSIKFQSNFNLIEQHDLLRILNLCKYWNDSHSSLSTDIYFPSNCTCTETVFVFSL